MALRLSSVGCTFYYSGVPGVLRGHVSCTPNGTGDQAPEEWVQCQAGWGRLPAASRADSS